MMTTWAERGPKRERETDLTHLPASYTVDAIGEISELIVSKPSYGRSCLGRTIVAETFAKTLPRFDLSDPHERGRQKTHLVFPSLHSTIPNSSPNTSSTFLDSNNARPSVLKPCFNASKTNSLWAMAGSSSRGIVPLLLWSSLL